jgi:hypothetical protein
MKKFIFSLWLFTYPIFLAAANMHALLIGDSQSDKGIVKEDLMVVRETLASIAEDCGMKLNMKQILSKNVSSQELGKWFRECEISEDDCLFIYFTGLGYCQDKNRSLWPSLLVNDPREPLELDTWEVIIDTLKPRLTVVLYDAANVDAIGEPHLNRQPTPNIYFESLDGEREISFKSLFLDSCGKVFIAATKPGEPTFTMENKSLFTLIFFYALVQEASNPTTSWQNVIDTITKLQLPMMRQPLVQLSVTNKDD